MTDNPYAPPSSDEPPPEVKVPGGQRRSMPGPVVAVLVLVSLYVVFALGSAIANPLRTLIELPILVLVIAGLARGHPLAWQWGMILPLLAALFQIMGLLALLSGPASVRGGPLTVVGALIAFLVLIAGNLAIPILLAHRTSRLFFGLQCPSCGGMRVKAASFLFNKLACRTCSSSWARPR